MEHEQIAAQVKKLTGKNNDAAYAALCTLEAESEASAAVCVFWDAFAAMLDDKRTYVRMRGMVLLACNAQWAGPEQVMEMLERYLAHITDEKAAAARWCVQRLPQFAAACPAAFREPDRRSCARTFPVTPKAWPLCWNGIFAPL